MIENRGLRLSFVYEIGIKNIFTSIIKKSRKNLIINLILQGGDQNFERPNVK